VEYLLISFYTPPPPPPTEFFSWNTTVSPSTKHHHLGGFFLHFIDIIHTNTKKLEKMEKAIIPVKYNENSLYFFILSCYM
jgi:hypothetical protein